VKFISAKVFYNAIIRFVILNALKFAVASIIAIKAYKTNTDVYISSGVLFALLLCSLSFFWILRKNHKILKDSNIRTKIGTLYTDKNVDRTGHNVQYFPLAFFVRRVVFACAAVYLFESPQVQMIVHHILSMLIMTHLAYDRWAQASTGFRMVEIGSEVLLHFTSILLSQFSIVSYSDVALESMALASLGTLVVLNLAHMIILTV